jgi:hypothetical protein
MMKLTLEKMTNVGFAVLLGVGVFAGYEMITAYKHVQNNRMAWKQTACPSLLSIGRSSRDTLIIMKNLSDCNSFVLDNLK